MSDEQRMGVSALPTGTLDEPSPTSGLGPNGLRSTSGHTPGPWRLADNDPTIVVSEALDADGNCTPIADVLTGNSMLPLPHDEPNARLIAAAPDLLDALQYLVSLGGGDCLDPARAAIAKATGAA